MTFINHKFRWMAVLGGLICLFAGNGTTAQQSIPREGVNALNQPAAQQVTGATFDDACNEPNLGNPPCDDTTRSLGSFAILVDPAWRTNMADCPGYDADTGILTSPTLFDETTEIGRSATHLDDSVDDPCPVADSDLDGARVGKKMTCIADATFSIVPIDKAATGFEEGPPGTREVHTEIQKLNLCVNMAGDLPCVRAGHAALFKDLPVSPGEVESKSDASGDPKLDFPAESFFNLFVEVELPPCGSAPFPGTVLVNDDPLLLTNNDLRGFPPQVVYIHGSTPAVPVFFNLPHPEGKWLAGDRFGRLILAGHGVGVTEEEFKEAMEDADGMCVDDNVLSCWSGCLMCEDPGCSEKVGSTTLDEETNFSPVDLALVGPSAVNRFRKAVLDILGKQDPEPQVEKISNVQDAIATIQAKQGRDVVIFGHGSPGHFRIGDDDLADPDVQTKFAEGVQGKIKSLTLFGCEVSQGAIGQAFLKKLMITLRVRVKTWDGKLYAFGNDAVIPEELRNKFFLASDTIKKEIPTVTAWGMVVMMLLVLAAGTIIVMRRRAVEAA